LKWLEESEKQAKYDLLMGEPPEPRVWDRIQDVPTDVRIVNRDDEVMYYSNGNYGDRWYEYKHGKNDPSYYVGDDFTNEMFGPFTEVLEGN